MKFTNRRALWTRLRSKYPPEPVNWFSCDLELVRGFDMLTFPHKLPLSTLIRRTHQCLKILNAMYPLVVFPDRMSGWKGFPHQQKYLPLEISNGKALDNVIKNHFHNCTPKGSGTENYHITDQSGTWFIIFCHEYDWHFHGPKAMASLLRRKWKRTYSKCRVEREWVGDRR